MRLPVPPREQRGGEDASQQQPCKSEFQKNTGLQQMVYFPIKAKARPFSINAENFANFQFQQIIIFMKLDYKLLQHY